MNNYHHMQPTSKAFHSTPLHLAVVAGIAGTAPVKARGFEENKDDIKRRFDFLFTILIEGLSNRTQALMGDC